MKPQRNPSEERLLAYAAGTLSPPEAVVMAAHLAMRPANDAWVRDLQSVGGEFLNETLPSPLSNAALALAVARIETDAGHARRRPPLHARRRPLRAEHFRARWFRRPTRQRRDARANHAR